MDWDSIIKRKSEALRGIIDVLFALLGLDGTEAAQRIPKSLHSAVLGVLRPAESAVRRLIVIAARGLVVKLAPARPIPEGKVIGKGGGSRPAAFKLADTRKNLPELREPRVKHSKHPPRILFLGPGSRIDDLWPRPQPAAAPAPEKDGRVSALRLRRRLQALKLALDDLPRQARRMARWRQRREAMPGPKFTSPLRPGPPPASATFIPSTASSPTATGSPGRRCGQTRVEVYIISVRNNLTAPLPRLRRTLSHGGERE